MCRGAGAPLFTSPALDRLWFYFPVLSISNIWVEGTVQPRLVTAEEVCQQPTDPCAKRTVLVSRGLRPATPRTHCPRRHRDTTGDEQRPRSFRLSFRAAVTARPLGSSDTPFKLNAKGFAVGWWRRGRAANRGNLLGLWSFGSGEKPFLAARSLVLLPFASSANAEM